MKFSILTPPPYLGTPFLGRAGGGGGGSGGGGQKFCAQEDLDPGLQNGFSNTPGSTDLVFNHCSTTQLV